MHVAYLLEELLLPVQNGVGADLYVLPQLLANVNLGAHLGQEGEVITFTQNVLTPFTGFLHLVFYAVELDANL